MHYKKQTGCSESSSDTESEYYIPKKKKPRKKITKKYKRCHVNDGEDDFNDYIVNGASESNEESDNFDNDDDDYHNANYEKTPNKTNKKTKKERNR